MNFLGITYTESELEQMLAEFYESPVSLLGSGDHTVNENKKEAQI